MILILLKQDENYKLGFFSGELKYCEYSLDTKKYKEPELINKIKKNIAVLKIDHEFFAKESKERSEESKEIERLIFMIIPVYVIYSPITLFEKLEDKEIQELRGPAFDIQTVGNCVYENLGPGLRIRIMRSRGNISNEEKLFNQIISREDEWIGKRLGNRRDFIKDLPEESYNYQDFFDEENHKNRKKSALQDPYRKISMPNHNLYRELCYRELCRNPLMSMSLQIMGYLSGKIGLTPQILGPVSVLSKLVNYGLVTPPVAFCNTNNPASFFPQTLRTADTKSIGKKRKICNSSSTDSISSLPSKILHTADEGSVHSGKKASEDNIAKNATAMKGVSPGYGS